MVRGGGDTIRKVLAASVVLVAVLFTAQPAVARSAYTDDSGDAYNWLNGKPGPAYVDIVAAEISLKKGTFTMTMVMADDIPAEPALVAGVHVYWWEWAIDSVEGYYPIGPWWYTAEECMVLVAWNGEEWTVELYDWTSVTNNWRDPILIRDLEHEPIGGSPELVVYVPAEWIYYPSGDFDWAGGTLGWMSPTNGLVGHVGEACDPSYAWFGFDDIAFDRSTWSMTGHWPQ